MKRVKFSKVRRALRGKGFAIALLLSVTAVGASTYLAYNQAISKIGGFENEPFSTEDIITFDYPENDRPVNKAAENIPLDESTTQPIEPVIAVDPTIPSEEANRFIQPKVRGIMPVQGEILNPYSNNELVKSKTLGVWKTHDGIDIAAPLGTTVLSMTDGVVSDIYSDALWGVCIIIDHGDGLVGYYFGLDKSVPVAVGQEVGAGDVIGAVGNTAEIEISEDPHIHFAVKKNGEWVNPVEYFNQ